MNCGYVVPLGRRGVAVLAVTAGLAIGRSAAGQMPSFDLSNITWLQSQGLTGAGVTLGQIENGLAAAHTSFAARMALTEPGVPAQGFVAGGSPPQTGPDNVNHATHVAGIMISGADNYLGRTSTGVAPGAQLVNTNSDTAAASGANFYGGLDWLSRPPLAADVINISWGSTAPNIGYRRAVDWVGNQRGKLVVVACDNTSSYAAPGTLNSPEDGYNILAVGATGWRLSVAPINEGNVNYRRLAWYSGIGPAANGARKPDIVAPGTAIWSASGYDLSLGGLLDDYSTKDFGFGNVPAGMEGEVRGCSFAAPHVSGVAGLLVQHANNNPAWAAEGKSPATLRAVLINGASKNVYDRGNVRWDANAGNVTPVGGADATPMDPQTGSGLLDARRTYEIFRSGNISPDVRRGGPFGPEFIVGAPPRPNVGWSRDKVYGTGVNGNGQTDLMPAKEVRKGSYITSTLAWELDMTGANPGAAADAAGGLKNLDLRVFKDGGVAPIAASASVNNSVEHSVVKAPDRSKYLFNVQSFAGTETNFSLAWHTYEAPTELREFNGDFMGDRGALNDNGWFDSSSLFASATVTQPPFVPGIGDETFAMTLNPGLIPLTTARMAQEIVTPTAGFWLSFDAGFSFDFTGSLDVTLGGLDLLDLAGYAGGVISPVAGTNIQRYARYIVDLSNNPLAGLAGAFNDLRFEAFGSVGLAYVDNIVFVPTPASMALLAFGGLIAGSRRRR